MALKVWAARLDRELTAAETERLGGLLPPERLLRLERTAPDRHREPLCAYGLLGLALREHCGLESLPSIARSPLGKPFFPERPELCFSLSHTEGAVLAALSDGPVGADIQVFRPVGEALLRRFGTDTPEAFFRSWVRREARAKRTGTPVELRTESALSPAEGYWPLETFPGFFAGVSAARGETPALHLLDLDTLLK